MKVTIIRPTIALKRQVMPGDQLEVSKEEAVQLIGANKAVAVKERVVETTELPRKAAEAQSLPESESETPETETAEAPKRGKKKASES